MPQRIDNRPLPRVEVVDLREEFKQRRALFSQRLAEAMAERLVQKQQIILFLNRRGYAQFVLCRDCGWAAKCPNCAVSLAFHAYDRSLKCHHCDFTGRAPLTCPDCGGAKVKAFGIGTEKVEEEVRDGVPLRARGAHGRDTTARKGAHTRIVRDFRQGDADILIGTQMVAKGLDFPECHARRRHQRGHGHQHAGLPRRGAHVPTADAGGGPGGARRDARRGHHPDVQPGPLRHPGGHSARLSRAFISRRSCSGRN